jgi:predicted XRE-type DNA-binding protein
MRDRKPTQTLAATTTGMSRSEMSRLLKGGFHDVPVERILRMLTRLGCTVNT